jgi:hypothetical protein
MNEILTFAGAKSLSCEVIKTGESISLQIGTNMIHFHHLYPT